MKKEEKYIIDLLLQDFLKLEKYRVVCKENYHIYFGNKELIIKNSFFNLFGNDNSYIQDSYLPDKIQYLDNPFENNNSVPIIYGENRWKIEKDRIFCGLDIFASSFFMLSRWEELILPKDKLGRCDENTMYVVKNDIYNRPIVNEYLELLRSILVYLEVDLPSSNRIFQPIITHDIDDLFRYDFKNFCRNLLGDLLHRKSISIMFSTIKDYCNFKLRKVKDPFDTFDYLMDLSDRLGFKNEFYFKASLSRENDSTYDIFDARVKGIMEKINRRDHLIGFHPSKNTFNNSEQFRIELERLKSLGFKISGGRQHFLLYNLPETINVWKDNGLGYDTGLGFYDLAGFRCGTCYNYKFWNALKRKECPIIIKPLILMEGALLTNKDYKLFGEVEKEMFSLVDQVKKYNGDFVLLWHNDNFKRYASREYAYIYEDVLNYIAK